MNDDMFEQQTPGDLSATLNSMLSGVAANYRGTVHSNANDMQRNSDYD